MYTFCIQRPATAAPANTVGHSYTVELIWLKNNRVLFMDHINLHHKFYVNRLIRFEVGARTDIQTSTPTRRTDFFTPYHPSILETRYRAV